MEGPSPRRMPSACMMAPGSSRLPRRLLVSGRRRRWRRRPRARAACAACTLCAAGPLRRRAERERERWLPRLRLAVQDRPLLPLRGLLRRVGVGRHGGVALHPPRRGARAPRRGRSSAPCVPRTGHASGGAGANASVGDGYDLECCAPGWAGQAAATARTATTAPSARHATAGPPACFDGVGGSSTCVERTDAERSCGAERAAAAAAPGRGVLGGPPRRARPGSRRRRQLDRRVGALRSC